MKYRYALHRHVIIKATASFLLYLFATEHSLVPPLTALLHIYVYMAENLNTLFLLLKSDMTLMIDFST